MKAVSILVLAGAVGCAFVRPVAAAEAVSYKEKVLWSFGGGTDGQYPAAELIDVNGTFYGTTQGGGFYGDGTVFSLDPTTGAEKVLYFFCQKGEYCLDGSLPWSGLIDVKGKLYGTTNQGGTGCNGEFGCGTVFLLDPGTGKEKVVYSFAGRPDGSAPIGSLIHVKGLLYGTTDTGGTSDFGTAFALDRKAGTEKVLYSFCTQANCTDGRNSAFALIDVNGTLYGTTVAGGADQTGCDNAGCGTVFSLNPKSGAETVLYSFKGGSADGSNPEAGLIAVNGTLYGTTMWGGGTCFRIANSCGVVFSLDPGTGAEKVLHFFCQQQSCPDGADPRGGLIDVNGLLYGTTSRGSCDVCGTVFSIDPSTGAETVLYTFCSQQNCVDGAYPMAGLVAVNGKFYGTTFEGGAYGYGTVFEIEKKH